MTEEIYKKLLKVTDVLWDDRGVSAGAKFADADLIGCPLRVVVSERSLKEGGVEIKSRDKEDTKIVTTEKLLKMFQ